MSCRSLVEKMKSSLVFLLITAVAVLARERQKRDVEYIDLSHPLDETTLYMGINSDNDIQYAPQLEDISEGDDTFLYHNFKVGEHVGTHMDTPVHFRGGDWDLLEIPLERLSGPAVVIDIRGKQEDITDYAVSVADIIEHEELYGQIPEGAIVFMCSGWDQYWDDIEKYFGTLDTGIGGGWRFPGFSGEAVIFLREERSIRGFGTDTLSLDVGIDVDFSAHAESLLYNIWGLENCKATCQLPPIGATVYAFPLPIRDGSGFPLRVVAQYEPERVEHLLSVAKHHPGIAYADLLGNSSTTKCSLFTLLFILQLLKYLL